MFVVRGVISAVFFLFLFGTYSWAGDLLNLSGFGGIEKLAPALRSRLEQNMLPGRLKTVKKSYRLIVTLRNRELPAEFAKAFSTTTRNNALKDNIKRVQNSVLAGMVAFDETSFKVITSYKSLYGFSVEATFEGISGLAAMQDVSFIDEMPVFQKMDTQAFNLTGTKLAHSAGWTGKGITIAVIDDGIDSSHAAFGGYAAFPNSKIPGGYDFADNDSDPTSDCIDQSHGTAVAGVAVGNGGGIIGTAPDANLVFLKVQKAASCGESTLDGDIVGALDWAITNRNIYGIRVVSMSLGTSDTYSSPCSGSFLADALVTAGNAGLVVVAASGNEASVNGLSDPACHPDVISVGAVYDSRLGSAEFSNCTDSTTQADMVSCYSNSAYFLDILAPSHCATTALAGGGINTCFGGTSSSAPYIAGVLATFFEKKPTLNRNTAIALLLNQGENITDPRNGLITPRVNHKKSLDRIVVPLANGTLIRGLVDVQGGEQLFSLSVPAGISELQFQISGGSGDADLYVKYGSVPTVSLYDCRPFLTGNKELCSIDTPRAGMYYIMIHGRDSYSGLTLLGAYKVGHAMGGPLSLLLK